MTKYTPTSGSQFRQIEGALSTKLGTEFSNIKTEAGNRCVRIGPKDHTAAETEQYAVLHPADAVTLSKAEISVDTDVASDTSNMEGVEVRVSGSSYKNVVRYWTGAGVSAAVFTDMGTLSNTAVTDSDHVLVTFATASGSGKALPGLTAQVTYDIDE